MDKLEESDVGRPPNVSTFKIEELYLGFPCQWQSPILGLFAAAFTGALLERWVRNRESGTLISTLIRYATCHRWGFNLWYYDICPPSLLFTHHVLLICYSSKRKQIQAMSSLLASPNDFLLPLLGCDVS